MSPGQSLRKGSSVEPGLPKTFLMPNARNRSKVACLTVRGVVFGLRDNSRTPTACDAREVVRHGRARPGHPRLCYFEADKTWMPGTRPGMTENGSVVSGQSPRR